MVTWGEDFSGGDSSAVQDQLQNVAPEVPKALIPADAQYCLLFGVPQQNAHA